MKYIKKFEVNKYEPVVGDIVMYEYPTMYKNGKWIYENIIGQIKQILLRKYLLGDINNNGKCIYENWVSRSDISRLAKPKEIEMYLLKIQADKFNL